MIPATFSIKGFASIRFANSKEDMKPGKIWAMLTNIWSYYPEKVEFYLSSQRGSKDKTSLEDDKVREAMYKMVSGCIETCTVQAAVGKSANLLLGSCYEYRIPFGVRSSDTGHETMLLPLPLPMDGCYILTAQFDGTFKKKGTKEHYMVEMNLDIHIGSLTSDTYESLLNRGIKVYPFKLRHPEYFSNDDSSGSEFTTDASDAEAEQGAPAKVKGAVNKERTRSILRPSSRRTGKKKAVAGAAIRSALEYLASSSRVGTSGKGLQIKDQGPPSDSVNSKGHHTSEEDEGHNNAAD